MDRNAERQLATHWDDVRVDHRRRYEWADRHFPTAGLGLDAFCGAGYGTQMLTRNVGRTCLGIDGSAVAVEHAKRHFFTHRKTTFAQFSWPEDRDVPKEQFDFIASLESVEHVDEPAAFVELLLRGLRVDGVIVISTPNDLYLKKTPDNFPFHKRHFTFHETLRLLDEAGVRMEVFNWGGQNVYRLNEAGKIAGLLPENEMDVIDREHGQFTLAAARRIS